MSSKITKPSSKGRSSKSKRAQLNFPVGRVQRYLKDGNYAKRVATGSAIYLTAVLEYLVAEILELSSNACEDFKKTRITPRHILLAIKHDDELKQLLHGVIISNAGVMPRIETKLLPKKTAKAQSKTHKNIEDKNM